jgi:hypothetical protein
MSAQWPNRSELDREVRDRLRRFGATAGVWARRVRRGDRYEHEGETVVPAGSFARLFALLALLRRSHEGTLDPNVRRPIKVAEPPRGGAPVFRHLMDDPELTVMDCARLMMLFDDAVAFSVVREALAADASGAEPASGGGADPSRWIDRAATVCEIGGILERAVRGTLVSPDASATVLEVLREMASADPSLVPASLPSGATMGRLRRMGDGVLADVSVTFLGDETVVASLYVVQDPTERSGRQLVDQLTGLLLDWALAVS